MTRSRVGNGPDGVAFGGGFVWVANGQDGTVSQIDPRTDTVVQTIVVGNGPSGRCPRSDVWVANTTDGTMTRIERRPAAVEASADDRQRAELAVGDGAVWVTSEVANRDERSTRGRGA